MTADNQRFNSLLEIVAWNFSHKRAGFGFSDLKNAARLIFPQRGDRVTVYTTTRTMLGIVDHSAAGLVWVDCEDGRLGLPFHQFEAGWYTEWVAKSV
jgi:hypothetical protein